MNTLLYFLRETFRSLWQAKLMTVISIVTIGVTLFFLSLLFLLMLNINRKIEQHHASAQVSFYLDISLSEEDEHALFSDIRHEIDAENIRFISRKESYEIFQSLYGNDLLAAVNENPFPAVIELTFSQETSPEEITTITKEFQTYSGIDAIVFAEEWLEKLHFYRGILARAFIITAVIMAITLFFTITNTVKLTVYAREELVRNMQYVGASQWYIRIPFVLEGIFQGLIGATLALIGIIPLRFLLGNIDIYWGGELFAPALLGIGMTLGFWGSFWAVRRFI